MLIVEQNMSVARQAKVDKRARPLLWLKGIGE
jgi:hypothetical protein